MFVPKVYHGDGDSNPADGGVYPQSPLMNSVTTSLDLVTSALTAHGSHGRGTDWQCPAHDDREASLSVSQGSKGVLINCHAGCATEQIVADLGLDMKDLFDEPLSTARREVRYRYVDESGVLLHTKVRYADRVTGKRKFRFEDANGERGMGGEQRVLYNLPALIKAVANGETVYVTEGESDVEALAQIGVTATTSHASEYWKPEFAEVFRDASVIIVADNDATGYETAERRRASIATTAANVQVVRTPLDHKGADVRDHLEAGRGVEELVPIDLPRETPPVSSVSCVSFPADNPDTTDFPDTLTSPSTAPVSTEEDLLADMKDGDFLSDTWFEPLQYPIPGIVTEGFFILAAPPKAGKSWMVLDWLLAIASGGKAMGKIAVGDPRHVLYLALEDGDRRMQSRCRTLLGEGARIPSTFHYKNDVVPGKVIPTIEQFMARFPDAAMVVVDTLGRVMPGVKGGNTLYKAEYDACSELTRLAGRYKGLSLGAVHHTRQGGGGDFVEQVSGTSGITGGVDLIMTLARERNTNEGTLSCTGRDIEEGVYALTCDGGRWIVDGADLADSADIAYGRSDVDNLGNLSKDILRFVEQHPEGVRSKEIVAKFGNNAYKYIQRLNEGKYIDKLERGLYVVTGRAA